jgi:outer membrane immunogenic protein
MKTTPALLLLLVLPILLASSHVAQAQQNRWSGLYVGGEIGFVQGKDEGKEHELNGLYNGWEQDTSPKGSSAALLAGYNWRFADTLILGFEGSYKAVNADDRTYQVEVATGGDCEPGSDCTFVTDVEQTLSLLGRMGYLLNSDTFAYVVLGFTRADIARSIHDGWDQQSTLHNDVTQKGETYGFGIEFLRWVNLGLRLDYRYSDLGRHTYVTPAFEGVIEKQDYRQSEVSVGLNFHF